MLRDESIQVTDKTYVVTQGEAGLKELFLGNNVKFVEAQRLEPSPIVLGKLFER